MINFGLKKDFLKFLIDFDFLILDKFTHKKNKLRCHKIELNLINNTGFTCLDPIESIKGLKQSIRILQYLKNSKNSILYIQSDNDYIVNFLNLLLLNNNKFKNIKIIKTNSAAICENFNNNANALFLVGKTNYNKDIYEKNFYKKIFLINDISTINRNKDVGIYKLYNNLFNWKKILFLSLLIKNIYKDKEIYENSSKI